MNFSLFGKLRKFSVTFPFLLVILGNLWIWRIFNGNLLIGLSAVFSSLVLYKSITTGKFKKILILLVSSLFIFQLSQTDIRSLTHLTEQQKVLQRQRLNEHPPVSIVLGGKTIWIPLANWLELRPEALILCRLQENLSSVLSPNLYFFANHPNERVGVKEHEKFPYILLPFFIIGLLGINFRKGLPPIMVCLFAPILLMAAAGTYFDVEPIGLFPFIAVCSILGLEYVWENIPKLKLGRIRQLAGGAFVVLYALVFIQSLLFDRL
jgi:hypothetical protein